MLLAALATLASAMSCSSLGDPSTSSTSNELRAGDSGNDEQDVDQDWYGSVLTSRNNNARTGANLGERILTPSNVSVDNFGLVYTRQLEGKVYAQPLYVSRLSIPNVGRRNVVYVVTEHNMVYAFDADDAANATPIWSRNLGPTVPAPDVNVPGRNCVDITPEIGISSAPVIDLDEGVMYVVAKVEEAGVQNLRINVLDIRTGASVRDPVDVGGSVPGTASDSVNGVLTFNPVRHNVRAGLLLHHGVLYVTASAHCDFPPWHGWVFAYQAGNLKQRGLWVTTPDGEGGAPWMSGMGMSADRSGVYVVNGNGTYENGMIKPMNGFGQTLAKLQLTKNGLELQDWFIPFNVDLQNFEDADLASAPMLVPNSNLVVAMSRGGRVPLKQMASAYILPRDNFGHFHANQADEIAQTVIVSDPDNTADPTNTLLQRAYTMAHWQGPAGARLYCWAQNDFARAYSLENGGLNPAPVATGTDRAVSTTVTGMISISANGDRDGILWGSINVDNADKNVAKTMLFAFDATTMQTLWNSRQNRARDEVGTWGKWAYPTIAGGKVFLANADAQLRVYGLLH
jgi:hypothetical protein